MAKSKKPPADAETLEAEPPKQTPEEALAEYQDYVLSISERMWQFDQLPQDLNVEEQMFVRSYVIDRNELAALNRIGYSGDRAAMKARAKRYLAKPEVKEAIDYLAKRLMEKLSVTAEKVQAHVAAVAFFDPREIMEFDRYGVQVLPSRFWQHHNAVAIKGVKMGQNGLEITFHDRMKATEMLSKQLGMQPEDTDAAEAARIGADEAMAKIGTVLSRLLPGGKAIQQRLIDNDPKRMIIDGKV